MQTGYRFQATDLHQFVVSLFTHLGSTPGEATLVADHLIAANLAGHDSHGVGMIPSYVKSHAGGFLQLNRHATVTKDAGAVVTLDGDGAVLGRAGRAPLRIATDRIAAVDSTGAGDSFAGGYLAARLQGLSPEVSARSGNKLASIVIQHSGAIIPSEVMPVFVFL